MKNSIRKVLSLALALCCLLSLTVPMAFAAEVADATINESADCSLTLYSYDWTNAVKDEKWVGGVYQSDGLYNQDVNDALGGEVRKGDLEGDTTNDLGNGEKSYGYAIKGKEFTYVRVADIVTFTESANDQHPEYNLVKVLYGFDKVAAADLLAALNLTEEDAYANAAATDKLDQDNWYYESGTLNDALSAALATDSTSTKTALETYAKAFGTAMELTDEYGKTSVEGLDVGLYLLVETKVPEMVTSTTAPFFVSLPMTAKNGTSETEGGHYWNYKPVMYPKNETGIVTLEKTVREAKEDTGKNGGTSSIPDGYEHSATASAGDTLEYQIISTLPNITSAATYLTDYSFVDTLSKGLSYTKGDLQIEWFTDKDCTNKVTTWNEADGKFTVTYSTNADNESVMNIAMTADGIAEINADAASAANINNGSHTNVHGDTELYAGYANYTMRITYTAVINSDCSFIYGENSNLNEVVLYWKRTSNEFYDSIVDDCHVYSFGLDLTKHFSDMTDEDATKEELYDHVKFKVWNETDKYWVKAEYNAEEGIYYVTDHVDAEADATAFTPHTAYPDGTAVHGSLVIKGLEDDTYIVTEIETADGYTLLKDAITVTITAKEDDSKVCTVYADESKLGVYQNDGHYYFEGCPELPLANIPQIQLEHNYLTAEAVVDTNKVSMKNDTDPTTGEDTDSENALVPVTVVNTPGIKIPETGSQETQILTILGGVTAVAGIAFILFLFLPKRKNNEQ